MPTHKWSPPVRLEKSGHRVFRDIRDPFKAPEQCAWAIADNSGVRPELTDDGVLWLDFTRPLHIEIGEGTVVSIPLSTDSYHPGASWTGAGAHAFLVLRKLFPHWRVTAGPKAKAFAEALAGLTFVDEAERKAS